jgi:hypothetical protein
MAVFMNSWFYLLVYNAIQPAENQLTFRRNMSPPCWKLCLLPVSCWFTAWLILRPWRWRRHVYPKRWLISNRLHGVSSQMASFFSNNYVYKSTQTHTQKLAHVNIRILINVCVYSITFVCILHTCVRVMVRMRGIPRDRDVVFHFRQVYVTNKWRILYTTYYKYLRPKTHTRNSCRVHCTATEQSGLQISVC